jgi:tetratricopeptide (TPR) repeat protein
MPGAPRAFGRLLAVAAVGFAVGFAAIAIPVYRMAHQASAAQPVAVQTTPPVIERTPARPTSAPPVERPRPIDSVDSSVATPVRRSAPKPNRPPVEPTANAPIAEPAAVDRFALALDYQRAGDYANAVAQYRQLLEEGGTSAEIHNNLGVLHQEHGNSDEAIREFRRAIALDPRDVKAHNNLGVAHLRAGRLEQAAEEFRAALTIDSQNVESIVNLALVHRNAGRLAEAHDLLRRAVAVAPQHPESHYNLAVVADDQGDVATAVAHYRAFLRYGATTHPDLAARVRSRLTALGSG